MSPWHVVLVALAGWLNREQQKAIEYLKEENRVLREQLGTKRLRFNDEQRRRLAVKGKELGMKMLRELGSIVTPDTILTAFRELLRSARITPIRLPPSSPNLNAYAERFVRGPSRANASTSSCYWARTISAQPS